MTIREETFEKDHTERAGALLNSVLLTLVVAFTAYTCVTIAREGPNFFGPFLEGLMGFGWAGQISFDLVCFSTMAGLWIAWRHEFNALGLALGAVAAVAAWVFVGPYMLVTSFRSRGNLLVFMLGQRRARELRFAA